jgi:hypothetical protein
MKKVLVKENELVDLIEQIVAESVATEKKKWISETTLLVNKKLVERITMLEKQLIKQ